MRRRLILATLAAVTAAAQSFEVASVKPHPPAVDQPLLNQPDVDPIRISGNRVALEMISLKGLVMAAYGVKEHQVSGVPAWASRMDSTFDIAARAVGDTAGPAQVRLMLQNLLTERFHLKLRRESKQMPVYNLVVATSGLKLKEAAGEPKPGMRRGSADQLAALLSLMLDRPVIDRTGLAGAYDYTDELTRLDVGAQDPAETVARVLAAVRGQLGLRAEPGRAAIELLVIESAEKPSPD